MDRIQLHGLRVRGRHGVYQTEREQGQEFVVDAVLELDLAPASASDEVADTIDYGGLADRLAEVVAGPPVNLLETLATRLCQVCLADRRVLAVTITVHKPEAPIDQSFRDVSVTRRVARPGRPDSHR